MKSVDGRHVLDTIMAHEILGYMHTLLYMWWCLTDDGLQRLTQSRGESSSLTDDGLDHVDHLKWALVGPTKTHVTTNCPSSDADVKSELDVQELVSLPFYYNK